MRLDDFSIMPWGKHKGKEMIEVPDDYLIYMYQQEKVCSSVKKYIEESFNENDLV